MSKIFNPGFKGWMIIFNLLLIFLFGGEVLAYEAGVLEFAGRHPSRFLERASQNITRIISDMGRFAIFHREEMKKIIEARDITYFPRLEAEDAREIGEKTGVDIIFAGILDKLEASWDSDRQRFLARAEIVLRIIEAPTGQVTTVISRSGSASHRDRETAKIRALENCFDAQLIRQLRQEFLLSSSIKSIDEDTVIFYGGRDLGVIEGSRFKILSRERGNRGGATSFRQVGLLQVTRVGAEESQGQIIYATEEITRANILEEIVDKDRFRITLGYRLSRIRTAEQAVRVNTFDLRLGSETPFSHSTNVSLGFSAGGGVFIFNLGGEHLRELPLIPGSLYGTWGGAAGFDMGVIEQYGQIFGATGIYAEALAGLKFYPSQEHGMTLALEGVGRLATTLASWQEVNGGSGNINFEEISPSGLGLRFSLGFGF